MQPSSVNPLPLWDRVENRKPPYIETVADPGLAVSPRIACLAGHLRRSFDVLKAFMPMFQIG